MRNHKFELESIFLDKESLSSFDAIILSTDHDDFNYELIKESSSLIIDTRGVYKEPYDNIIKA
jgi:UDP-N-acetyl-D-glucosamine dehydrogenase